jgi:hypothetical protein
VGSWLVEDCEDKKLQQSDLRVSFSLDVVVVAFMNTEGPLVPFPMSYYPYLQIKKYFIIQQNN